MRIGLLGAAAMLAVTGCALTGAAPGGPLRAGTTTQIQTSWAFSYGSGSGTVFGTRFTGNAESYESTAAQMVPVPMRIGLRQSLGSAVEASADVGWLDSGVELRAGTPGGTGAFPFAIAAGLRGSGYPSDLGEKTSSQHVRFEIYPDVSKAHDGSFRLVFSAGVGRGSFAHSLDLPGDFHDRAGETDFLAPVAAIVVRPETRLELGVGIHGVGRRGDIDVALLPWIVLDSGAPIKATCPGCGSRVPVTDYAQSWGVSLMLTPTAFSDVIGGLISK
jgi:hypothetical protein